MTEFAVATVKQARGLRGIKEGHGLGWFASPSVEETTFRDGLWERVGDFGSPSAALTEAGKLALELRQALGPDRGLTKAGARALVHDGPTRATKIRLMDDGLWKRAYTRNNEPLAWLTEDGRRVREILLKYRAEV